jgi:hypothetical protein
VCDVSSLLDLPKDWRLSKIHLTPTIKTVVEASLPQFHKHSLLDPVAKVVVGSGFGTQLGLAQGGPLTTRPQYVEDRVGAASVRGAWPATTKAMGVHALWEQRLHHCPQLIGDPKARRGLVVWGTSACALRCCLCAHTPQYTSGSFDV